MKKTIIHYNILLKRYYNNYEILYYKFICILNSLLNVI